MKFLKGYILFLCFFSCFFSSFSQDYHRVDETIKLYPTNFNSAEELSFFITRDFTSDEEKVRAMFSWIITNVAYDPEEYKKFDYSFKNYRERNEKEENVRQKIIQRTLQTGNAVCEGYAMLLEKLCELQGIQNYLVRGDVKSSFDDLGRTFKRIHMWNVITIDGKSHLFDATWGAGKWNGSFKKDPDYFYYKTPPKEFVKTHYPDQDEDSFLEMKNYNRAWFSKIPLVMEKGLSVKEIQTPNEGVLKAENYINEIPFVINAKPPKTITYLDGAEKVKVSFEEDENSFNFKVPLKGKKQKILVYFDDKPALAYKVE